MLFKERREKIGEGNEMYLLNTRGVAAFKTIKLRINKNLV